MRDPEGFKSPPDTGIPGGLVSLEWEETKARIKISPGIEIKAHRPHYIVFVALGAIGRIRGPVPAEGILRPEQTTGGLFFDLLPGLLNGIPKVGRRGRRGGVPA